MHDTYKRDKRHKAQYPVEQWFPELSGAPSPQPVRKHMQMLEMTKESVTYVPVTCPHARAEIDSRDARDAHNALNSMHAMPSGS